MADADKTRAGPTARANRRHIRESALRPVAEMHEEVEVENASVTMVDASKRRVKAKAGPLATALNALRNEFKTRYVPTSLDQIPYNKNMVRNFSSTKHQTEEQRIKRKCQADASRVSRDRIKFIDGCVRKEHERLEQEMFQLMIELRQTEQEVNALRKKKKRMPIDWSAKWE